MIKKECCARARVWAVRTHARTPEYLRVLTCRYPWVVALSCGLTGLCVHSCAFRQHGRVQALVRFRVRAHLPVSLSPRVHVFDCVLTGIYAHPVYYGRFLNFGDFSSRKGKHTSHFLANVTDRKVLELQLNHANSVLKQQITLIIGKLQLMALMKQWHHSAN